MLYVKDLTRIEAALEDLGIQESAFAPPSLRMQYPEIHFNVILQLRWLKNPSTGFLASAQSTQCCCPPLSQPPWF